MVRRRGALEAEVLQRLRSADRPLTAKQVQASFVDDPPAVTTLLTVLDRLRRKGWVERSDARTNITFRAVRSASEEAVETMLQSLQAVPASDDRRAVLMRFAGDLDRADAELLARALRQRSRQ